jgi:hypothetical protein
MYFERMFASVISSAPHRIDDMPTTVTNAIPIAAALPARSSSGTMAAI